MVFVFPSYISKLVISTLYMKANLSCERYLLMHL